MKKLIPMLCVLVCMAACTRGVDEQRLNEVVVYAYDSFTVEWGPGPALAELFTSQTGYNLIFVDAGDAVQALSRAILEKQSPLADVLVGVDNNTLDRAQKAGIARAYQPRGSGELASGLVLDPRWEFTPYDWSYFALVYDTQSDTPPPSSLEDLTKQEYAKKLILMDPRTSTPGLGFVAWTLAVFGGEYAAYWKALKPNILTMAPGWSAGYGLFTQGEAPLVISYTTSPPYHIEYERTSRYKALIFESGHITQVEFAAVIKGAKNPKGAEAFMDFLISPEAQDILPLTQWMYPANRNVALPSSFSLPEACLPAGSAAPTTLSAGSDAVTKAADEVMRLLAE